LCLFIFITFVHILLMAVFFVRFLIYFDETDSKKPKLHRKSIPAYGFQKSQEKILEPKVSRVLPNVYDFQKENHTLGYGFKNLQKIIA
jgi:hypothetical protein